MDIRPIRNEADLDWALAEVAPYFETEPELGTPEGDRFMVLTTLIKAYEDEHWALPMDVDPIAVIKHAIDDLGKTYKELVAIVGSTGRASEIMNKKRALSIQMIRAISEAWQLPVELLIQPYELAKPRVMATKAARVRKAKRVERQTRTRKVA